MNTKKIFLLGFLSGAFVSVSLVWIFTIQYPLLISHNSKSSYAIGQQIGRNLKNQNFEISSYAFAAAVRDAQSNLSRLDTKELAESRRHLFNKTPQAHFAQEQMSKNQIGEDGYFTLDSGTKFKFLSDSKKAIKSKKDLISVVTSADQYRFFLTVLDSQEKEIYKLNQKNKSYLFKRQQLSSDIVQILNYLSEDEKVQIKIDDRRVHEIARSLKITFDRDQQLVLQRLKAQTK